MKSLALLAFFRALQAQYNFVRLLHPTVDTGDWHSSPRALPNTKIRCNRGAYGGAGVDTANVTAGITLGFHPNPPINHQGPLLAYLAKWFKYYEESIVKVTATDAYPYITIALWPSEGALDVYVPLPSTIPSGEYLLRIEHIALHNNGQPYGQGPEFYLSCAHVNILGGGSATPGSLVAFPGAYSVDDSSLNWNIYNHTMAHC
ncbi:hypothetical protein G7Y89_g15629 [Cudoniella acicularis]|uniref:lytic cellulose monooxygenase (C4-dehydrogenating) n=1 Tax=Cudoniella acicularis TaxID=354080 RepID=A0A8H4VKN9_9HELO|nr:hypothetical protein G7Y89_g15629 [Cudoniella acicularis]